MLAQIHPHYVAPMCQPVVRMANRTVQLLVVFWKESWILVVE